MIILAYPNTPEDYLLDNYTIFQNPIKVNPDDVLARYSNLLKDYKDGQNLFQYHLKD